MGLLTMLLSRSRPSLDREGKQQFERLQRNRRTVDGYLRKMASIVGQGLSLKDGICCFTHGRFVVVLEVPESHPDTVFLSTCVFQIVGEARRTEIREEARRLNNVHEGISGSTLEFRGNDEVHLCLKIPIDSTFSPREFRDRLAVYLDLAVDTNRILGESNKDRQKGY